MFENLPTSPPRTPPLGCWVGVFAKRNQTYGGIGLRRPLDVLIAEPLPERQKHVTIFRLQPNPDAPWTELETALYWDRVVDHVRSKFHGPLPADDPAFEAAMALQRNNVRQEKRKLHEAQKTI